MTWWPSVPTRAVMAPTIAGSSSTTRMRRALVPVTGVSPSSDRGRGGQGQDEPRPAGGCRLAPESRAHRFGEAPGGIEPDAGPPRRLRLAAGVGLEDPLPPLLRD